MIRARRGAPAPVLFRHRGGHGDPRIGGRRTQRCARVSHVARVRLSARQGGTPSGLGTTEPGGTLTRVPLDHAMRFSLFSDLHLEMGPVDVPELDVDAVILAGDIHTGVRGLEFARGFAPTPVIYVAGNHEYYRHAIPKLSDALSVASEGTNTAFLERGERSVAGARVLGATLWTDFGLYGEDRRLQSMEIARERMTDFHVVRRSPRFSRLAPADTLLFHRTTLSWLTDRLREPFDGPTVIVTHHAPHVSAQPEEHVGSELAPAFVSDLSSIIERYQPDAWVFGHTHHNIDRRIGRTRLVTNQRGYPDEPALGFRPDLVIEV